MTNRQVERNTRVRGRWARLLIWAIPPLAIGWGPVATTARGGTTLSLQLETSVGAGNFGSLLQLQGSMDGTPLSFYAGPTAGTMDGGHSFVDVYCVDFFHDNYFNGGGGGPSYLVDVRPIGQVPGGGGSEIAYLYNTYAAGVHDGHADDVVLGAALQVAIWKAEYGDRFLVPDGPTGSNQDLVFQRANAELAGYPGHYDASSAAWLVALDHPANPYNAGGDPLNQDQVGPHGLLPPPPPTAAPEPSTLITGGIAVLFGLVAAYRRRRSARRHDPIVA